MNNFEALVKGVRQDGVITYYERVSSADFGVDEEFSTAFMLGLELNACWQMVMSADSFREFERDVADYDECVDNINKLFGAPVVKKMVTTRSDAVTLTNPETGEEQPAEFFADVIRK